MTVKKLSTISVIAAFLLLANTLVFSQTWRVKNRIQASVESDDNITETIAIDSQPFIQGNSLRLLIHSSATRRARQFRAAFVYKGGIQSYFNNKFENKLIHEISGQASRKLWKFVFGLRFNGRLKIFLNNNFDYGLATTGGFLGLPTIFGLTIEAAVSQTSLDYSHSNEFDLEEFRYSIVFSKKINYRLFLKLQPFFANTAFDERPVFIFQEFENNKLVDSGRKRKDEIYSMEIKAVLTKPFLFTVGYQWRRNDSNDKAFAFSYHQLSCTFALPLPGDFLLRSAAAAQFKKYRYMVATLPITGDPEQSESNFMIIDLSKDLNAGATVILRLALHNNESTLRNHFYRKKILNLGFDFRF